MITSLAYVPTSDLDAAFDDLADFLPDELPCHATAPAGSKRGTTWDHETVVEMADVL